jgi:hypothetical protein
MDQEIIACFSDSKDKDYHKATLKSFFRYHGIGNGHKIPVTRKIKDNRR